MQAHGTCQSSFCQENLICIASPKRELQDGGVHRRCCMRFLGRVEAEKAVFEVSRGQGRPSLEQRHVVCELKLLGSDREKEIRFLNTWPP